MARPSRVELSGGLYHISARGNQQADVYQDDADREYFLSLLAQVVERFDWRCHAYCLMDDQYHLLIEINKPTLSKGMKLLNGPYTQYYNRLHQCTGQVFQGRFKSVLVQKEAYFLPLARDIVLTPVKAGIVRNVKNWRWSSYRATAGLEAGAACLTSDDVLANFAKTKTVAQRRYCDFVQEGKAEPPLSQSVINQVYLGDDKFIISMKNKLNAKNTLKSTAKTQKKSPIKSLASFAKASKSRDEAMAKAYLSGHYTLDQVGEYFQVSDATVSRALKAFKSVG